MSVAQAESERQPAQRDYRQLAVRASAEYLAWLSRLAVAARAPISVTVDHALTKYASIIGFDEPPPRR